jgi:hypothetical protein
MSNTRRVTARFQLPRGAVARDSGRVIRLGDSGEDYGAKSFAFITVEEAEALAAELSRAVTRAKYLRAAADNAALAQGGA